MTRDDIIRLAQEAGITYQLVVSGWGQHWIDIPVQLERFAALVAAAEREACAKVCEEEASRAKWNWDNDLPQNQPFWNGGEQLASSCAAAIRVRGQE
jgi:hypothetical protein